MNIDVGKFNITSDNYNVLVQERYIKKDESEGLRFVGYYSSTQNALRGLLKVADKQSDAKTAKEWLDGIVRHKRDIEDLIASVDFNSYRDDMGLLD